MMRRLIVWIMSPKARLARLASRKRKHEKKLRAMGVSKSEALRISSARFGDGRH